MKRLCVGFLSLLVLLYGVPCTTPAQSAPESFTLPKGIVGEPYRANIESVLRETYHLRLETDAHASIFRWALSGGEIPPGLVVRPNGTIVGIARTPREEPYTFQLRVVDLAMPRGEALILNLNLSISAARIRLAHLVTPKLVSTDEPGRIETVDVNQTGRNADLNSRKPGNNMDEATSSPSSRPPTNDAIYASMLRRDVAPAQVASGANPVAASSQTSRGTNVFYSDGINASSGRPATLAPPLPSPTPKPAVVINNSTETATGEKVRGPATIEVQNANVLRYDVKLGKEVSFTPGPDLKLPFIPPIPEQPKKENKDASGQTPQSSAPDRTALMAEAMPPTCTTVRDCFNELVGRLNGLEQLKTDDVNGKINTATSNMNSAKADLESLVSASDSVLMSGGGAAALISNLTPLIGSSAGATGTIDTALSERWPDADIDNLIGALNVLKNDLLSLPTVPTSGESFDSWYKHTGNKAAYDAAKARIEELQTQLNGLKSSSTQGTAFQNAQSKLRLWKPILASVRDGGVAGFTKTMRVGCNFAFDSNKESKIKLGKKDRLADAGATPTSEEIVTVVCSSPFSISAGFGFSAIDEKEFVFVPSTKTVTANGQTTTSVISRFGFRSRSGYRPLPVLLLNTRVWEPNDTFALHLSTGAVVDAKTGQGGTELEYIVGPSISFHRSFFITPGLHIGRVSKLAGGFTLDQEVPTGISEPPLEKAWKKAFVTTFTYKIK